MRITPLGLVTVGALALPITSHAEDTYDARCYPVATCDLDGDGYADPSNAGCSRTTLSGVSYADKLQCPAGYVKLKGDCDDGDAEIHPRQWETGNDVDDNCDGRVDESEFYYLPWGSVVTTDSFELPVRMTDSAITSVLSWLFYDLEYVIEYEDLTDTSTSYTTGYQSVDWHYDYDTFLYTHLELDGLESGHVYRARAQFYRKQVIRRMGDTPIITRTAVGEQTPWYYQMTLGTTTLGVARTEIVNRGLYEHYRGKQLGQVGYHGSDALDGTDYGADLGESWCSEFYSTVVGHETSLTSKAGVSGIRSWFESFSTSSFDRDVDITNLNRWRVQLLAKPGDYLAEDTDLDGAVNHSAMFLAWDNGTGDIITLDGNTNGYTDLDDGSGREGDEVSLRRRDPAVIVGWGRLGVSMLE